MSRAIRILREMTGRNIVADAAVHANEEFLSESVGPAEFAMSRMWQSLIGSYPDGGTVERLIDDRFANGEVLVVGREGTDWVELPSQIHAPRLHLVHQPKGRR